MENNFSSSLVNCAFITDESYAMPTTVAITSIKANANKESQYNIYVLTNGLSGDATEKLLSLNDTNFSIIIKNIDGDISQYYNFTESLPDLDKVLFLSGNTVAQKDILEIYDTDVSDYCVAAVHQINPYHAKGIKISEKSYFDSSVMLLNLVAIREAGLTEELANKLATTKNLDHIFNIVFKDKVLYLPFICNVSDYVYLNRSFLDIKKHYLLEEGTPKTDCLIKAKIISFAEPSKPWEFEIPFREFFNKYYDISPYQNNKLNILPYIEYKKANKQLAYIDLSVEKREIPSICNDTPLISVIMPVYNAEEFLSLCLDSIIYQSFFDFELICIDDGSTDNSKKILNEYAKIDPRIKVYSQKNSGAGAARNFGITKAKGEYFYFVDSDDFVVSEAFENFVELKNSIGADIYVFNHKEFDTTTLEITKNIDLKLDRENYSTEEKGINYGVLQRIEDEPFLATCHSIPIPAWNKIYSKAFIEKIEAKFDEIPCANDRTFFFHTILNADQIVLCKSLISYHRKNISTSLTSNFRLDNFDCHFKAYYSIMDKCADRSLGIKARLFWETLCDIFAFFNRVHGDYRRKIFSQIYDFFVGDDFSVYESVLSGDPNYFKYKLIKSKGYLLDVKDNIIPIVFSINNNYALYLAIALKSLVQHANSKRTYEISILHTGLDQQSMDMLQSAGSKNVSIELINISSMLRKIDFYQKSDREKEQFFRILIPELFNFHEKVIYLDSDIILQDDIAKLMDIDLGDSILGAVKNPLNYKNLRYSKNILNLNPNKYYNFGVIVFNNTVYLKERIHNKCLDLIKSFKNKLSFPCQDVLNIACCGNITDLPYKWNYQWNHNKISEKGEGSLPENVAFEYFKAEKFIKLLHFSSLKKPWNNPDLPLAYVFWKYAKSLGCYEQVIYKNISKSIQKAKQDIKQDNNVLKRKISVSVIVPVYNSSEFLGQCLNSIKKQTLKGIEIICIDDGSTDSSFEIMRKIANQDSRFIIARQKNQGAAVARNKGLAIAQGEYLAFLDSDDYYHPHMLEKMYKQAKKRNADVVICKSNAYDQMLQEVKSQNWALKVNDFPKKEVFSAQEANNAIFTATNAWPIDKIFKASFIRANELTYQKLPCSNDVKFVLTALAKASRITLVNQAFTTYRKNQTNNTTAKRKFNYKVFLQAYMALKNELIEANLYNIFEQSFLNRLLSTCIWQYELADTKKLRNKIHKFLRKKAFPAFGFDKHSESYFAKQEDYQKYLYIKHNISTNRAISKIYNLVTWPFRMVFGFFKCLKVNGIKYTIKRVKAKFKFHLTKESENF